MLRLLSLSFFFFNDTATTEIYTLSLHDALPILAPISARTGTARSTRSSSGSRTRPRSEEHTSELQSRSDLVCRLLLEKRDGGRNPTDWKRHLVPEEGFRLVDPVV